MKSIFISFLVSISILFSATASASMPVVDVGAATLLTKQLAELKSQAESLKKQLENLSPDSHQWGNTQNLINQLQDNIRQSNALAYSAGDLDQRFRTTYAGYKASKNYQEEYRTITNSSQQTFNNVLRNHGLSAQDFQNENTRLAHLQQQSQNAQGQLQAIQAANMMASEQIQQLQLLRETVMSQTTAQSAYFAAQIQKEAMEEAAAHEMFEGMVVKQNIRLNSNPIKDPFDK